MSAPLSIIIPTLNAAPDLPASFAALFEGVEAGLIADLLVADGGSTDATLEIAEDAGARLVTDAVGRGAQMRAGAEAARGPWLLFLHADSRLPAGWTEIVAKHMRAGNGAAAFRLQFDDPGMAARLVAGWANLRSRAFGLPYGDQGLLIARGDLERAGGYPNLPLMEDVALARALKGRITLLPGSVTTSAARYRARGWLRQGSGNLFRLVRFLAGTDPAKLAQRYR